MTMNRNRNVNLEQAFLEAKIASLQSELKSSQETVKYWEKRYYSRLQETLEARNVEKTKEIVEQQFANEIEHLKSNINDLEEEKANLVKIIEKIQYEYRKARKRETAVTYERSAKPFNIPETFAHVERTTTDTIDLRESNQKIEEQQKQIAENSKELEILKDKNIKANETIAELNRRLGILRDENCAYSQQIDLLIVRLSMVTGKPLEVIRPQIEEVTNLLGTNIPQPKKTFEDSGTMMLESANNKVRILQLELKLQEDRFNKVVKDNNDTVFVLKEKIRKLQDIIKLMRRNQEMEDLEGYKLQKQYRLHGSSKYIDEIVMNQTAVPKASYNLRFPVNIKDTTKSNKPTQEGNSDIMKNHQAIPNSSQNHSSENTSRSESSIHDSKAMDELMEIPIMKSHLKLAKPNENINNYNKKYVQDYPQEQMHKDNKEMNFNELFEAWKRSYDNDTLRAGLLAKITQSPKLMSESIERHAEYLGILSQAFSSRNPLLYSEATICLSEILERRKLDFNEFEDLDCEKHVIDCLGHQRPDESEGKVVHRHSAALNVLAYMKGLGIKWNDSMIKHMNKSKGMVAIRSYLKNFDMMEGISIRASYAIAYIASCDENIPLLKDYEIYDIVMDVLSIAKSRELVENSVECLAFLMKDDEILRLLEQDGRLGKLVTELSNEFIEDTYRENLLQCLLLLSKSKQLRMILCDGDLGHALSKVFTDSKKLKSESNLICALKIAERICYTKCSDDFLKSLLDPLVDVIDSAKSVETIVQALVTLQKLLKCDGGKLASEYLRLVPAVLDCTKSMEMRVAEEAFKAFSLLSGYSEKELLTHLKDSEDVIKRCIKNYCSCQNLEMVCASQNIIKQYLDKRHDDSIEKLITPELLKSVLSNVTIRNVKIQKTALEILSKLLEYPKGMQIAFKLKEIGAILKKFTSIISITLFVGDNEM